MTRSRKVNAVFPWRVDRNLLRRFEEAAGEAKVNPSAYLARIVRRHLKEVARHKDDTPWWMEDD